METREHQETAGPATAGADSVQGEGDYRAARAYREGVQEFLEHANVEEAARAAAPRDPQEARDLEQAEEEGRSHAKAGSSTGTMTRSLGRVIRRRPMTAILVAGALGYLVGWVRRG